jgi:prolyl 4-hydroxylase
MSSLSDLQREAERGQVHAQRELGNALLATSPFGTPDFNRGLEWLTRAAEQNDAESQWYLGCVYLQVLRLPDPWRQAAHWFAAAAAQHFAPALDRLADLHAIGMGVKQDDAMAFALTQRAAAQAYPNALWTLGYLHTHGLGTPRDAAAAALCHAQALALGHPAAYFALGLRFAAGHGVLQDRAFGQALLARAADAGYPWARQSAEELQLDSAESARANDWYARLKVNLQEAQPWLRDLAAADASRLVVAQAVLEHHLVSLGHPAFRLVDDRLRLNDGGGDVPGFAAPAVAFTDRLTSPHVLVQKGFATREECAHFMALVDPQLGDPTRYARGHAYADVGLFDGEGVPLTPTATDLVVRHIERRVRAATGASQQRLEPFSVVRYLPGQQYKAHVDYFSAEQLELNRTRFGDMAGQRLATFLIYLHEPDAGGETEYLLANTAVAGEPGMGLLHWNCLPDGRPDERSVHAGKPVVRGEKWLARMAIRERPLY